MRACLARCVGRLMQLRKACTYTVGWVTEFVHERTDQCLYRPTDIYYVGVRLHVVKQLRAEQFSE
eukprot:3623053-Pleurochrysis_carterae.AAC.1